MKTIRFLNFCLFMAIFLCSFSACSDDETEEPVRSPYLYAKQTLFEIDATAQTITVTVNTNIPNLDVWVPDEYPWVQLLETEDAENSKTLLFQIAANTERESRQGTAVIIDPENRIAAVTIAIRQSAAE